MGTSNACWLSLQNIKQSEKKTRKSEKDMAVFKQKLDQINKDEQKRQADAKKAFQDDLDATLKKQQEAHEAYMRKTFPNWKPKKVRRLGEKEDLAKQRKETDKVAKFFEESVRKSREEAKKNRAKYVADLKKEE